MAENWFFFSKKIFGLWKEDSVPYPMVVHVAAFRHWKEWKMQINEKCFWRRKKSQEITSKERSPVAPISIEKKKKKNLKKKKKSIFVKVCVPLIKLPDACNDLSVFFFSWRKSQQNCSVFEVASFTAAGLHISNFNEWPPEGHQVIFLTKNDCDLSVRHNKDTIGLWRLSLED